jgi:hypothetical protein
MSAGPPPLDLAHLPQAIRWWMWIAVALLLIIARFLPIKLPRRTVGVAVCGSIAAAVVCLHFVVTAIRAHPGIERKESFDQMIAEMARSYDRQRPTLLVIGSSRATLGLDGNALEQKLKGGLGVQVLQFSSTGHYALEQLYTTRRLIERMRPERLTVLVELGTEIDLGVPEALAYTTRGIDFFDARVAMVNWRLWRAARAGNADHPAYSNRQLLRALTHTAMRHLGIGLLFDLQPPSPPTGVTGFAPKTKVPAESMVKEVRQVLAQPATVVAVPSDRRELVAIVRDELVEDLRAHVPGPVELVFFVPPTAAASMRAEAPVACEAVAHLGPCLYMSDDEVRTILPADKWSDTHHMTATGAASFTDWLAGRLAEKLARR